MCKVRVNTSIQCVAHAGSNTFLDCEISTKEVICAIKCQNWGNLRMMLQTSSAEDTINDNKDDDALILACKFGAPFDIIMELISIKPKLLRKWDARSGHTPLHIACRDDIITEDRASIISLMATQYSTAAVVKDLCGMTPLHLLCKTPCRSPEYVVAVHVLCKKGPLALMTENEAGETPIETFLMMQNCRSYEQEGYQKEVLSALHSSSADYLRSCARG